MLNLKLVFKYYNNVFHETYLKDPHFSFFFFTYIMSVSVICRIIGDHHVKFFVHYHLLHK